MLSPGLSQGWPEANGRARRLTSRGWASRTPDGKTSSALRGGAPKIFVIAALAALLIVGAGCSTSQLNGASNDLKVRPSASETDRLIKNAYYYKLLGRPEAGLKELEKAHQQDPDNLKIIDTLAQTYQDLGKFQLAQQLYQEALDRNGSDRALRNNLCFSYYLQGDLIKAEACFKEALNRDPGNTAARNNLGLIWCRQGKLAEAQKLWEEKEGAIVAQDRLNKALAFLGKSPPAQYAKATEPKPAPATAPPVAALPKPAAPVKPAPEAKGKEADTKTPVKAPAAAAAQTAVAPPKAAVKTAAKAAEAKSPSTAAPTVPPKPAVPVKPAALAKTETAEPKAVKMAPALASSQKAAVLPQAGKQPAAKPFVHPAPLTVAEREAGIEVRNGTRTKDLAHLTRALLSQEGFNVVQIGNHIDFGAEATVIYYRPEGERLAQTLKAEIFPAAQLAQNTGLKPGVAVKVLLGHDLQDQPRVMARLTGEEKPEVQPAGKARLTPPLAPPAAANNPAVPAGSAPPAKAAPAKPEIEAAAPAVAPMAKNQAATQPEISKRPLTAEELVNNLIEIRNGTRKENLAHQTRSLLSREGFSVGIIGNHIDFGAEVTEIYYRPEAERVARALNSQFFPGAHLTPSDKLNHGMAVKVVLGRDLLDRPQLMSRLQKE